MNYSTAVMLINPTIRAVTGKYEEGGGTTMFKTIDQDLKVDDLAVVVTKTRWGMTVVKITAVDVDPDYDSNTEIEWVVDKIDHSRHQEIKAMEYQAINMIKAGELRKRREDIKRNTLDAFTAGEIDNLAIARLGNAAITDSAKDAAK